MAELGAQAFVDPSLSASGGQACVSCHSAAAGQAAPNDLAVQRGGPRGDLQGQRNAQPLRYLETSGPFRWDSEGKPRGGYFWDGRADSLAQQAEGPLLGPREMANPSRAAVAQRIRQAAWAGAFVQVFGPEVLADDDRAFEALTQALARFQAEDTALHGFTSKYDAVLRRQAQLSAAEARGLALFNDPAKGNCAACHTSALDAQGGHPLFTDFSYDNLGVPRNPEIEANAEPSQFDLGLCGRPDLAHRRDLCGAFKVPSLRNVAQRRAYFHNGRFKSLSEVLRFYVQRDTQPEKWYPVRPGGGVRVFDDLPPALRSQVNTREPPYDRRRGMRAALDDAEIEDLLSFLQTLSDGWQPR